jgi:hypothetical protein
LTQIHCLLTASANRVGIANNSPSVALDVTGAAKISSTLDLTSHLDMPDSAKIKLGTGDDLEIYHDASDSYIKDTGTGALEIWGSGINIRGTDGGYLGRFTSQSWAGLFHNNTEKLRTTSSGIQVAGNIANSSGDMTIDVAGDIVLDAGGQNWYFDDDGTRVFSIAQVSSDVYIGTEVSDKDMIFRVNDGGSVITALTLDGSDAGSAKFNGPNLNITADDARLLVEEADGTNIGWFGDITGAGVGGCFLYNHGGTATVQIRADATAGFINNGANFGIGTSSPSAPLQVAASPSDTVGTVGISLKDVDNAIEFGLRLDATSKDLHIDRYYSGSWYNHMSFDRSTGNVGIGITPTHNFNLSASGAVEARFASTDNDTYLQISSDTDEGQDSILQFLAGTGAKGSITYDHNTTADSQKMIFKTGDNANDALYIYGDGTVKVGLGGSGGDLVLQPQAKLYLDAGGNTYIQESAGDVIDIYTGGTQRLRINSSGASVTGTVTQSTAKTKQFTGQYDGRETTTITLGSLGFKPQVLFCHFNVGTTQKASWGMAARDGGHQALLDYDAQAANDGYESVTSYFGRLAFGSAVFSNLAVSSWDDNQVVIQKSIQNGGSSSTCVYRIIVMG